MNSPLLGKNTHINVYYTCIHPQKVMLKRIKLAPQFWLPDFHLQVLQSKSPHPSQHAGTYEWSISQKTESLG